MKILVVDDHVLFREGLVSLLNSQSRLSVIGEAGTAAEAVLMAREKRPDLILMDFSLPDGDGPGAASVILSTLPKTKIVFLTVHDGSDRLIAAIRSGAKGYLLKDLPFSKLVAAIQALENDEAAISRRMTFRLLEEMSHLNLVDGASGYSNLDDLSRREIQILGLLAIDASNKEISDHLSLSTATVKNHLHRIFEKLQLHNRQEAARFARRHRLEKYSSSYQQ